MLQQQNLETYFKDFWQEIGFIIRASIPSYLLHLPEHPEEVEAGELAEVLYRPGAGVQERHEQLRVVAHIRQTNGDPA